MIEEKVLGRHRVCRMVVVLKPTSGTAADAPGGAPFQQKAHRAHVIATANVGADAVRDCLLAPLHTLGEQIQVVFMVLVESDDPVAVQAAVRKMAARAPSLHIRGRVVVDWALHLSQVRLFRDWHRWGVHVVVLLLGSLVMWTFVCCVVLAM
jgi:hypothetical protein